MIKSIPTSDISVRSFKVYKDWLLDNDDIPTRYGTEQTSLVTTAAEILHASIKSQYYRGGATASLFEEYGRRHSYASTDERLIESNIAVLAVPQAYYGEAIKVGSVTLTSGSLTFTDDHYSNLIDSGSNIKGNIFYNQGLVVLTKGIIANDSWKTYEIAYKSTKTIYENEIFLTVLEGEFNVSQNPTAIENVSGSMYLKGHSIQSAYDTGSYGGFDDYSVSSSLDPTGSFLAPFITTIGLYDDYMNMVAVAKLPQPIKSLHEYPVNFVVRFDT